LNYVDRRAAAPAPWGHHAS